MNAADLARLELAKRAHRATEPNASEVQRGVRKARLGLQRPRVRSTWLSRTVVAGVLAMGGLAYAKPHALGELVQSALRAEPAVTKRGAGTVPAAPADTLVPEAQSAARPAVASSAVALPTAATEPAPVEPALATPAPAPKVSAAKSVRSAKAARPSAVDGAALADNAPTPGRRAAVAVGTFPDSGPSGSAQQAEGSDWGRVGSALARGDESRALAVLSELSESEDRRTRDKADLGRAQLMMSNGNREKACATARSLTNRGAGSRIERQAQVLLKACSR